MLYPIDQPTRLPCLPCLPHLSCIPIWLNRIQWVQSTPHIIQNAEWPIFSNIVLICSDALQLNHIKPGLKWVIQIVPMTYDYLGWLADCLCIHWFLYTFPSASQKEWSSCPDHGRNHGRSTPTGSFSDCSCSSSVVVILGSDAVPMDATLLYLQLIFDGRFYGLFYGYFMAILWDLCTKSRCFLCCKFCELGIYVFIPMVKIEGLGTIALVDFKY